IKIVTKRCWRVIAANCVWVPIVFTSSGKYVLSLLGVEMRPRRSFSVLLQIVLILKIMFLLYAFFYIYIYYVYAYMCVCMYVYLYVYMYVCMCIYVISITNSMYNVLYE